METPVRLLKAFAAFPLSATVVVATMVGAPAAGADYGPISNFMTMDVCVGADNSPTTGQIPGDKACKKHRDIRVGETPSYTLGNFPSTKAACATGSVIKTNIPVRKGDNIRIVSTTMKTSCGSSGKVGDPEDMENNGASIQWYDQGYGFIMGSWSPVALSSFESTMCQSNSQSSARFFRGWVIGPATVPALGSSGIGVFPSKLLNGDPSTVMGPCATRYNRGLTTWTVENVDFKSNRNLVSLVTDHYARSAADGASPGDALQFERTYWTREFGLSRWEKWAREDWVHPRARKSAPDLARSMFAAGRCSPPMAQAISYGPQMQLAQTQARPDAYTRIIRNPQTGEQHTWYMTLCEDYTNTVTSNKTGDYAKASASLADDVYWK